MRYAPISFPSCGAVAALLAATAIGLGIPTSARGAVRDCPPSVHVIGVLSQVASILSVRNMSCRGALGFVRRYGRTALHGRRGESFRLGPYRCLVYTLTIEGAKARCTSRSHAFRVDYGT